MKILVTGAKGFVGKNLCLELKNIRDGKARCWGDIAVDEVFEYDIDSTSEELDKYCKEAGFVFNLAGVNRPKEQSEFMEGNFGFASTLLDTLKRYGNTCPVMLSSSQQASLTGRFGNSEYGRSKKAGEDLFLQYGMETGAKVLVYRFPNLYGKWCRPNYNSAVATFCNAVANDLPYTVNDPSVELELLYIDDLIAEMIGALKGEEHRCEFDGLDVIPSDNGRYCYCPVTHKATLGRIVDLLNQFKAMPKTLLIPEIPSDSFAKRLYSTYLSYLPKEGAIFDLKMNCDARGSFTELVHTLNCGQVSINISKPGITKGQHWHHTKWEQFIVVKGHGLIQMRPENPDQIEKNKELVDSLTCCHVDQNGVISYEVSGDKIQSVIMLPGYTHNIINLSDTEDLVTVMYCNEIFDPQHPDTFGDPV
ncbi:MAG: NAD-dependent epimerase/dehydratase family protein [Bacteroidales bacterium]|nr:NAD-dependent epimerase/dehydratase family protein [Bacteroidales bacterium]